MTDAKVSKKDKATTTKRATVPPAETGSGSDTKAETKPTAEGVTQEGSPNPEAGSGLAESESKDESNSSKAVGSEADSQADSNNSGANSLSNGPDLAVLADVQEFAINYFNEHRQLLGLIALDLEGMVELQTPSGPVVVKNTTLVDWINSHGGELLNAMNNQKEELLKLENVLPMHNEEPVIQNNSASFG